jgi:hypothetical protein
MLLISAPDDIKSPPLADPTVFQPIGERVFMPSFRVLIQRHCGKLGRRPVVPEFVPQFILFLEIAHVACSHFYFFSMMSEASVRRGFTDTFAVSPACGRLRCR